MLGPEVVADQLAARLSARLPGRLSHLRQLLDLDAGELPDPAIVEPHDRYRIALEEWPAVLVAVSGLTRFTPVGHGGLTGEEFVGRYPFRVFVWVRADDDRAVDLLRKRYVLAAREVLLARRALRGEERLDNGLTAASEGDGPTVDALALTEDYGPLNVDDAGRTIAAAYVAADALLVEVVEGMPARGVVASTATVVAADTDAVPPHPAL